MALKERKQITGTTSQINAYAGHEGQVVWDKDKKTLVGMSGTSGTNYPLATQEYADNKVSHLEGKVDTSNAAITEALNKKENTGTCLPLTGGIMKGGILFNNIAGIWQHSSAEFEELLIYAHDDAKNWQGGMLSCRGHGGSVEAERGSFALGARLKDGSGGSYLLGLTSGNLIWTGKEVERFDGFYAAQFDGGYCDVHRYVTGLQIVTAGITIPANQLSVTLTFTKPFINTAYSIAANGSTDLGDVAITWDSDTATSIKLYRKSYTGSYSFNIYVKCTFIGRWK